MNDYFIWNGTDCRTYGIHVSDLPPVTIPVERSAQTQCAGAAGQPDHVRRPGRV